VLILVLYPKNYSKRSKKPHKIFGFDIETFGDMNDFYMGSVYSDDGIKVFYDKSEMKKFFLSKSIHRYKHMVVATNLMFDFFALFDYEELEDFNFIFRGSELITCKKELKHLKDKQKRYIRFTDTFHFATKMSVKNLGRIIGVPKYDTPIFIGEIPNDDPYISMLDTKITYSQKGYMELYNIRDSEITYKFTKFFENSLIGMGGELKPTIASISLNYFRLKYLNNKYRTPSHDENLLLYKGYYGGRTEAFKRGKIKNKYYYDFNSLYPSVMLNDYPDPNSLIKVNKSSLYYIENYDGVTNVRIRSPKNLKIPLLPLRLNNKLIFPLGEFISSYTHLELRKALSLGYEIINIYEGVYFTEKINIFKEFVTDNYNKRIRYKREGNPIQHTFKIILNSLYGKFGQKYDEKQDIHFINNFDFSNNNVSKYESVEVLKDFFVITKKLNDKPPSFSQPIWSIYVTAYGRLLMYETFEKIGFDNVFYCDTDSIFTDVKLEEGENLGQLKLEQFIKEGLIIKPKFYEIDGSVKAKGLKGFSTRENLISLINDGTYKSFKFCKLKESLRRTEYFRVNQKIMVEKRINFNDNKRFWFDKDFNINELHDSIPLNINIIDGENVIL